MFNCYSQVKGSCGFRHCYAQLQIFWPNQLPQTFFTRLFEVSARNLYFPNTFYWYDPILIFLRNRKAEQDSSSVPKLTFYGNEPFWRQSTLATKSQNLILTLRRPLRRKIRMRCFLDISKVKESSFFKSDLTNPPSDFWYASFENYRFKPFQISSFSGF